MKIHLITPCIRPKNLPLVAESITIPPESYHWWIVLDGVTLPDRIQRKLPPNAHVLSHRNPKSISGNAQRNYALDQIDSEDPSYVYFLDDDTLMSPHFYPKLLETCPHELYHFSMTNSDGSLYVQGREFEFGKLDSGCVLYHRKLIGRTRWILNKYTADVKFAMTCARRAKSRLFLNAPLACYNGLRNQPDSEVDASTILSTLSLLRNPKHIKVLTRFNSVANQILEFFSAAVIADQVQAELEFSGGMDSKTNFDRNLDLSDFMSQLGFRPEAIKSTSQITLQDVDVLWTYIRESDLLNRLIEFGENNPHQTFGFSSYEFASLLPHASSIELNQCAEELKKSWQLFPVHQIRKISSPSPISVSVALQNSDTDSAPDLRPIQWILTQMQNLGLPLSICFFTHLDFEQLPQIEGLQATIETPSSELNLLETFSQADVLITEADDPLSYIAGILNNQCILHAKSNLPAMKSWWTFDEGMPTEPSQTQSFREFIQARLQGEAL